MKKTRAKATLLVDATNLRHSQTLSSVPESIGQAFERMEPGVRDYFQRSLRELTDIKSAIDKVLVVAITDPEGVITYVNDRFCELYGYSRNEVLGQTHQLLNSGEHSKEFYQRLWSTIQSGKIFEAEIKNRARDGSYQWAYMVIVPFLNDQGAPCQYVSFRTDITAVKAAEEERVRLIRAESAAATAEAAVQARDRFVSIVAHDLKTPITSLQLILDLLLRQTKNRESEDDSRESKLLNSAYFQTRRLTSIINDLLDVSRMTAGRLELKRELVDLGELVTDLVANSKADLDAAGCDLSVEVHEQVRGLWDRARLEQVVINLISNAMKYGEKKPIKIDVMTDGKIAQIKVKDHGIGIPKAFQDKLFHRFERAESAEGFRGVGLGLWITRQIIDAHQGKIRVESEEGRGSTFCIELPVEEAPVQAGAA